MTTSARDMICIVKMKVNNIVACGSSSAAFSMDFEGVVVVHGLCVDGGGFHVA